MKEVPKTAYEYSSISEGHARMVLKAFRHSLNKHREQIAEAERRIAENLQNINDAKRVMYENGWSE